LSEQDVGPIDYLALEFPEAKITGQGMAILLDLVDRGIIRILDLRFVLRGADGSFTAEGRRFGIGTIETTNGDEVLARRDEVLAALRKQQERGYTSVILAVIDILHERTSGMIGSLDQLIHDAANEAIDDGTEKITREHLKAITLDTAAEEQYRPPPPRKPAAAAGRRASS